MNMDASIILRGQPVNALGALAAGNDLAKQSNELRRQNALDALYKSQGAGIMNGDQNALNALAQFDPNAALGIKQTQQGMAFDAEKMGVLREAAKRAATEYAKQLSDADRTAQIAKIESGLKGAAFFYQNGDKAGYEGFLQQNGLDPAQYPFEAFPATAAQYDGVLEAYKSFKPEVPKPQSSPGKLRADLDAGLISQSAFDEAMKGVGKEGQTTINMGEGDKFYENLDKGQAEMFTSLMNEGVQATRTLGQIDQLEATLKTAPTGGVGWAKQFAGEWGIPTEGLSDIQAAQAIINQIVPQQRQPGSGPMSDADLALFKQSVPRLINQPGGNEIIIKTMRGIAEYTRQQAEIASAVADRTLTPAQGRKKLRELQNPISGLTGGMSGSQISPPKVGEVIDGHRFKGGDPGLESSWEKVN